MSDVETKASHDYIMEWALKVYHEQVKGPRRRFAQRSDFLAWVVSNLGHRPSTNHHLWYTGDYESPAVWVSIIDKQKLYHASFDCCPASVTDGKTLTATSYLAFHESNC